MPYETLIAALLEEGEEKCRAVLRKAQAEASRLLDEARRAAEALGQESESQLRREAARRRAEVLGRAALSARQLVLQAKQEALEAVWRRVTEKVGALADPARAQVLRALLDELLAVAPPGPLRALIHPKDREGLGALLTEKEIPFEVQDRDDLVLGIELHADGEILRSSAATRLAKAKPKLLMELNRLLFKAANS
jgi:vacuolar-type H+-ATPase subunit E/Vma4